MPSTDAEGHSFDSTCISLCTSLQAPTLNPPKLNRAFANITKKQLLHVVMVPYPVQGQINPMTQFAKLLTAPARKQSDMEIMVTMVHNQHNYDCIQQVLCGSVDHTDAYPATQLAVQAASNSQSKVRFTWLENGLPPDFDYNNITCACATEFHLSTLRMKEPLKHLLRSFKQQGAPVSCVLFGTFCAWAQSAAAEEGIPTRLFSTQSATLFSIYYHIPRLVASGSFQLRNQSFSGRGGDNIDTTDLVTCIPGLPPVHRSSLPALFKDDRDADAQYLALLEEQLSAVESCDGVIINSFEELEKDAFEALRQQLPCSISLVGPLLPSAFLDGNDALDTSIGASLVPEKNDCIKWLDGKRKHSILYIAFGSLFNPSVDEAEGIALFIQACKQPYLWVIRSILSSPDISDILPKGFVEDTREYGLIISWAPQLQVLSHPSVGAFLTHCGWNSTLEGLSMGMPMIAFPICVDQPTNSTYVCDFWKVGVALKRQDDGKVKSDDVEKALSTVFHDEEGLELRERASKLRDAARRAVRAHGSSYGHVEEFIQVLRNHAVQLK